MKVQIMKTLSYDNGFLVLWETIHTVVSCLHKPEQIGEIFWQLVPSCIFPLYFLMILSEVESDQIVKLADGVNYYSEVFLIRIAFMWNRN